MSVVDEVMTEAAELAKTMPPAELEHRAVELIIKIESCDSAEKHAVVRELVAVSEAMRIVVRDPHGELFGREGLRGARFILFAVLMTMDPTLMGDIHDRVHSGDAA